MLCNKIKYSKAEAEKALNEAQFAKYFEDKNNRNEDHIYQCPICHMWHLTSQSKDSSEQKSTFNKVIDFIKNIMVSHNKDFKFAYFNNEALITLDNMVIRVTKGKHTTSFQKKTKKKILVVDTTKELGMNKKVFGNRDSELDRLKHRILTNHGEI